MSDRPAVTVVIPTHNRRQLLFRALDSVRRQVGVSVRVVVVDDGGTDGTSDAVRGLDLDNVQVIRHERSRGVSTARNVGLATADTPWVAFVDDDDLWAPDKLAAQLASLQNIGDAQWSCVGTVRVDSALRVMSYLDGPASGDVSGLLLHRNVVPGGGSGVLVDTHLAHEVGGFDERISILADWDMYFRLSIRSPLDVVKRPLLAYYVHSDSMYHDPGGVLEELRFLEDKHQDLADGERFEFDRGFWFFTLIRMARRLGDKRALNALLLTGVRDGGARFIAHEVLSRAIRKAGRGFPRIRRTDARAEILPIDLLEQAEAWLSRYSTELTPGTLSGR